MILSIAALKRLAKDKKKRVGRDYIAYLNTKVEMIVLSHIHMLGSRGTLKAKDYLFLDAMNAIKKGR